jgi:hypothetical protein
MIRGLTHKQQESRIVYNLCIGNTKKKLEQTRLVYSLLLQQRGIRSGSIAKLNDFHFRLVHKHTHILWIRNM